MVAVWWNLNLNWFVSVEFKMAGDLIDGVDVRRAQAEHRQAASLYLEDVIE